jgi:hypothetical protein
MPPKGHRFLLDGHHGSKLEQPRRGGPVLLRSSLLSLATLAPSLWRSSQRARRSCLAPPQGPPCCCCPSSSCSSSHLGLFRPRGLYLLRHIITDTSSQQRSKSKFVTPQHRPTPHPTPLLIGALLPWDHTVSNWPWVSGDHPVATTPGPHFCGSAPLAGAPPRGPSRHGLPVRTAFFRFFPFPEYFLSILCPCNPRSRGRGGGDVPAVTTPGCGSSGGCTSDDDPGLWQFLAFCCAEAPQGHSGLRYHPGAPTAAAPRCSFCREGR